jgi:hypothetical protein
VVNARGDRARDEAIAALAQRLQYWHFAGDGCVEDDRPLQNVGGAAIIRAGEQGYAYACSRLGVDERDEGWALWYTWDDKQRAVTMVHTAIETTAGLLGNWARGYDVHPARLDRGEVAAVVRGWLGPVILSPEHARRGGLRN